MAKARLITAKFDGVCKGCKESFEAGDEIMWAKGQGAWHVDCWDADQAGTYVSDDEPYICGECGRAYYRRTSNSCCSSCNSQYEQGKADAERYLSDKKIYGEALAEEWEMDAELARYNRGEDGY